MTYRWHGFALGQECSNSIANAMGLLQSWTNAVTQPDEITSLAKLSKCLSLLSRSSGWRTALVIRLKHHQELSHPHDPRWHVLSSMGLFTFRHNLNKYESLGCLRFACTSSCKFLTRLSECQCMVFTPTALASNFIITVMKRVLFSALNKRHHANFEPSFTTIFCRMLMHK